jgi:hypothetical protein
MTINFRPLRSTHGFESPGFSVSPTGQLTISSGGILELNDRVDINDSLYVRDQIYIGNVPLLDLTDPSFNALNSAITESFLTRLGTLQYLDVTGNVYVEDNLANLNFSITNGEVVLTSTVLGYLDNINIGSVSPADAYFNFVTINNDLSIAGNVTLSSSINGPTGNITTINSTTGNITTVNSTTGNITTVNSTTGNITTVNSTTGNITTVNSTEVNTDDVNIDNTPVEAYHATRKDYVDNRISAFAIAFGA